MTTPTVNDVALTPAEQVAERIIAGQMRVVGKAVYKLAGRVKGLSVAPGRPPKIVGETDEVLERLVREFSSITGSVGTRMCFMAAASVLRDHPELDIPAFRPYRRSLG